MGTNSATLAIPTGLTAGTYTFTCVVTNTLTTGETASVTSANAVVNVKPVAPAYSAGSVAGDVSDKTITITNDTDFPAGTYKLYLASNATTAIGTVTLETAGTVLAFTGVEGLTTSATNFQISVTIAGQTSANSGNISITPNA